MTVEELIARLHEVPGEWGVVATRAGSLEVYEPDGARYGYVFTDGREPRWLQARRPMKRGVA